MANKMADKTMITPPYIFQMHLVALIVIVISLDVIVHL